VVHDADVPPAGDAVPVGRRRGRERRRAPLLAEARRCLKLSLRLSPDAAPRLPGAAAGVPDAPAAPEPGEDDYDPEPFDGLM
jgi:hypothetical protein